MARSGARARDLWGAGAGNQFRPFVIFVPARRQVRTDLPRSAYPRRLLEHARRHDLVAIDPNDAFKRELRARHDPYLAWDDHMSPIGHRLIAEAIAEQIGQHLSPTRQTGARAATVP